MKFVFFSWLAKPFQKTYRKWEDLLHQLHVNVLWVNLVFLSLTWVSVAWFVFRFESKASNGNIHSFGDALWWGIVTFLTVGYGDRYPVTTEGRFLACILMIAGVVSMGILTAKISSYFLEQALRRGRGVMDAESLKGHFVICGWKEEMHDILVHILDFNQDLTPENIVLIANVSQAAIDELHEHPRLRKINIISGDFFNEFNLQRANPKAARKIMILADRTPLPNGQVPTLTECDARTIMTAMTLSHIARGTLVTAEVLDPKMDQYLKLANVSEIVYSRQYNRLLLVNASAGTGVANIIFDLLDPSTAAYVTTVPIQEKLVNQTYGDLKRYFTEETNQVLVGLLENSGNVSHIKEIAIRKAQKTTDVNQLLHNLKTVKALKCNHSVFNPDNSHVIEEGTMAIVIGNREMKGNVRYEPGKKSAPSSAA